MAVKVTRYFWPDVQNEIHVAADGWQVGESGDLHIIKRGGGELARYRVWDHVSIVDDAELSKYPEGRVSYR